MQPDVALNPVYQEIYPFSKIVGNANILIMPALHSAAISTKLMKVFGGGKLIGPLLIGLGSYRSAPLRASTSEILTLHQSLLTHLMLLTIQTKVCFYSTLRPNKLKDKLL